jgi:protein O-GlcNAc transferase
VLPILGTPSNQPLEAAAVSSSPAPSNSKSFSKSLSGPDRQAMQTLVGLFQRGQHAQAEPLARALTTQFPEHPFAWVMLGALLRALQRNEEAVLPLQTALALSPADPQLPFNLGNALRDVGRTREAADCYLQAVQRQPQFAQAHYQLANLQQDLGQPQLAERSYRQALLYNPAHAKAHANLAHTLHDLGRWDEALASYQRAIQIEPRTAALHFNLADLLHDLGRLQDAQTACRTALQIDPLFTPAHSHLGTVLKDLGQPAAALASYRQALALQPTDAPPDTDTQSSLLFCLNYSTQHDAALCLREAQHYGDMARQKAGTPYTTWLYPPTPTPTHTPIPAPQRLRVGLVSGDLRDHPVGYFLEGFLAQVDPAKVEWVAFPTQARTDALTERIRPHFSSWQPLTGLSDDAAAQLVHSQGVQVLLDLSGHTAHNRLPLFARRLAPVQATWLGYFATTGLAEMDYLLADPWSLPAEQEAAFTEAIWRLPQTRLCFTPPVVQVTVNPLPGLASDKITFGCFNNLSKLNDDVLALWARVLQTVPNSQLFLKAKQLRDPSVVASLHKRFVQQGIAADRLLLEGPSPRADYLAAYHRVDIGLDPFPFPGGTTTAESLWMGVPVLTLSGERFLSRQGVAIAMNAGLPDWVVQSADDYVARAAQHAANLPALAQLRQGLREQVLASPLFDAGAFARHLEAALLGMWQARGPSRVNA